MFNILQKVVRQRALRTAVINVPKATNLCSSLRWLNSTAAAGGASGSNAAGAGAGAGSKPIAGGVSKEELDKLVRTNKVVVFMKGNPESPRCGFSNAVVQIMRMHGVQYDSHDVLKNEHLRQGIKDYSDWPTIPQVFINGEFVGGCDILLQMHQSGDLIEEFKKAGIISELTGLQKPKPKEAKD